VDSSGTTNAEHRSQSIVPAALLLCSLVAFAYWPVHAYDFVNWDDTWYVVRNPYLGSWSPANLKAIATDVINRNYAPLTIFTYLLEHTLFGLEPAGYHIFNVLLHAVNAVLVFVLISQLTKNRPAAWATAALFAVHPVQIESVAWISSMKGLLCGTFILAYLICRLRPERTTRNDIWGFIFFLLALFSKALTVVVPAIVLLYDMSVCRKQFKEALAGQFVTGMLSVWLLLQTLSAQGTVLGGVRTHLELGRLQLIAVDSTILWRYVGMLVWPNRLSVLYNPPVTGINGQIVVAMCAWATVAAVVWKLRNRMPLLFLASLTWLILLLPVLNLTPLTTLMNDRYLYMPSIPFLALLTCGLNALWNRLLQSSWLLRSRGRDHVSGRIRHAWLVLPMTATLTLLGVMRVHLPVWSQDRTLWEYTMTRVPELPVVRIQYAMMLHNSGEDARAVQVLQQTLTQCTPDAIDRGRITTKIEAWQTGNPESGGVREWVLDAAGVRQFPVDPELSR